MHANGTPAPELGELASREEFLGCLLATEKEPFTLPNGKIVWVGEISALEYEQALMEIARDGKDLEDGDWDPKGKARFIVRAVYDGKDRLIFSAGDVDKLAAGRLRIIDPLYKLFEKVNGLDKATAAAAKKNSQAAPASPGGSPETSADKTSASSLPT